MTYWGLWDGGGSRLIRGSDWCNPSLGLKPTNQYVHPLVLGLGQRGSCHLRLCRTESCPYDRQKITHVHHVDQVRLSSTFSNQYAGRLEHLKYKHTATTANCETDPTLKGREQFSLTTTTKIIAPHNPTQWVSCQVCSGRQWLSVCSTEATQGFKKSSRSQRPSTGAIHQQLHPCHIHQHHNMKLLLQSL